ncbi:MAG TPA: hypothetical protein VNS49_18220 [Streptomyces sp.]|nr:hypothetical protein [Streptomyces sp.]
MARDRLKYLRSPATWLAGILLAVATVTFQDVLTSTVKAVLPLDSIPDQVSPQDAIEVVEVRDAKEYGMYLVRGEKNENLTKALNSGPSWRQQLDTVDVGQAEWIVTLRGHATQQVRITDIVPEVSGGKCASALAGTLVYSPSQGEDDVIPLEVTIDAPQPRLKAYKEGSKAEEPYFSGAKARHITLNRNESEAFFIRAKSERGYCRWRYRVHYQVGGDRAEMVLSRDGKPFELTGGLKNVSGYKSVHFPSYLCPRGADTNWLTGTGEEYARAVRRGDEMPCPRG